jgi:hypothetical protein
LEEGSAPNTSVVKEFERADKGWIFNNKVHFGEVCCDRSVGMEVGFDMGTYLSRGKVGSGGDEYSIGRFEKSDPVGNGKVLLGRAENETLDRLFPSSGEPLISDRGHEGCESGRVNGFTAGSVPNLHSCVLQTPGHFKDLFVFGYVFPGEISEAAIFEVSE